MNKEEAIYFMKTLIVVGFVVVSFVMSIAIPCLISEQRNIDKELKFKELEIYGEYRVKE